MADAEIDLYEEDFNNQPEDFGGDGIDLYDDVIAAPTTETPRANDVPAPAQIDRIEPTEQTNGYHAQPSMTHVARRHQLYVGNLSWWTTDQDITDSMSEVGCSDFQEVKFFENRVNGQSKGFCVVSLGSEGSMRMVMDRLPKKEIHGQNPVVTLPTKQALNQFESQQKTRPVPAPTSGGPPFVPRGPAPGQHPGSHPGQGPPPGHQPRMMNSNGPMRPGPPGQYNMPNMPPQGPPGGPGQQMQRMQVRGQYGPPMHQGGGPMQGPPRYPNQQWNGMRPNGPPRPGLQSGPGQRPPMYQGGPPMRAPRPEWNRPPMHQFQQGGPPPQGPPMMQGPPRGPVPPQMGGPPIQSHGPPQGVAPHVNPAFFPGGAPPQHAQVPPIGPPHGGPPQQNVPPHFNQQNAPRGPWPPGPPQGKPNGPPFPEQGPPQQQPPQISEVEFEEIMARNRTVSSSAIARAVSDAAAGEYSSAIETLVTAISLIKQSKVAHDERCKILISSLQDTLHGIENKSYSSRGRERSRSRDRHRRARRERSSSRSRYRERSREREKDHDRDGRYYGGSSESYRETREGRDNRSRSRERERGSGAAVSSEHYRAESSGRTRPRNKSPEPAVEPATETSKRSYYDDRYRSSDRDRSERDRDRESRREEHRSRH